MVSIARSQRLLFWAALAAGSSPTFHCPQNTVTLVKSLYCENWSGGSINVTLHMTLASGGGITLTQFAVPTGSTSWTGWFVMHPGDGIYIGASGSNLNGYLSGAILSGGPQYTPAFEDQREPATKPADAAA